MFSLETITFYCQKILQLTIQSYMCYMWSFVSFKLLGEVQIAPQTYEG